MKQTKHTIINISEWPRREHFAFFANMADPYFGLTARVDFTECYRTAKNNGESLEANHGLADGRHIGQFFEKLSE